MSRYLRMRHAKVIADRKPRPKPGQQSLPLQVPVNVVPDDPRTYRHVKEKARDTADMRNATSRFRGPWPKRLGAAGVGLAVGVPTGYYTAKKLGGGAPPPDDTDGEDGDDKATDTPTGEDSNPLADAGGLLGAGAGGAITGFLVGFFKGMGWSQKDAEAIAELVFWALVLIGLYLLYRAFKK